MILPLLPRGCAFVFVLLLAAAGVVQAQNAPPIRPDHDPQVALRRALLVPGSGQLYNHQPVKAGLFYAGAGGIAVLAVYNQRRYRHFQRVFRYAERPEDFPQYADEAAQYATLIANGRGTLLRQAREKSRRNRDLSLIGGGLWYGLSVLDAYVNAHLIDFDTDERLSVRLSPHPEGFALDLRLRLP